MRRTQLRQRPSGRSWAFSKAPAHEVNGYSTAKQKKQKPETECTCVLRYSRLLLLCDERLCLSATCGLVSRPSTGAEIGDLFARLEERFGAGAGGLGRHARDLLKFLTHPTDARDFN